MSTATLETPDALHEIPNWITSDTLYEIIDGEYVEKEPVSASAVVVASRIAFQINRHAFEKLGEAVNEILVALPGSTRNRRPDVIYVSYNRWPKGREFGDENAWEILPEICIEVISPTDRFVPVKQKMREYFAAGVEQVWIVTPDEEMLEIYTSPSQCHSYQSGEVVDCNALIPGFQFDLAEVL